MKLLTDDEIFDLLDGIAPTEIRQRHQQLMALDENYQQYFNELRELHEGLAVLPLESPSLAFENKLLTKWEIAQSSYKIPVLLQILPFLFAGLLVLVLVGTFVFWRLQPTNNSGAGHVFEDLLNSIDLKMIQSLLLSINSLLLLLIFERILKKHWKRYLEEA
jgi:hypothetical protein